MNHYPALDAQPPKRGDMSRQAHFNDRFLSQSERFLQNANSRSNSDPIGSVKEAVLQNMQEVWSQEQHKRREMQKVPQLQSQGKEENAEGQEEVESALDWS